MAGWGCPAVVGARGARRLSRHSPESRQVAEGTQSGPVGCAGILLAAARWLPVPVGAARTAKSEAVGGTERLHRQCQMKLLPDRVGEFEAVVLEEGHVHVRRIEGALPSGQVSRRGGPGQVHQVECLVHGKRHRAETTDTLEAQFSTEASQEPISIPVESVQASIQAEFAGDLESGAGKAERCVVRRDGDPSPARRDRREVDTQGGRIVGRGQGSRILSFPAARGSSVLQRRGTAPHRIESPPCPVCPALPPSQAMVKLGRHPFAARSAAGAGCGEGFPLPTKDGGVNRTAIRATNPWGKRPAGSRSAGFGARDVLGLMRGAFTTGC